MSLNLNRDTPKKERNALRGAKDKFPKTPIGWWNVTTEGDVEGRSIKQLGEYYGHVAEIAFSVVGSACYSYSFDPVERDAPEVRPYHVPVRTECHIQLGISSGTWGGKNIKQFTEWLDAEDEVITSISNFYASFKIELKDKRINFVSEEEKREQDAKIKKKALVKVKKYLNEEEMRVLGIEL